MANCFGAVLGLDRLIAIACVWLSCLIDGSWGDLIEGLIPQAVASAIQSSQALRGGLPRDYLNYMGVVHSDEVIYSVGRPYHGGLSARKYLTVYVCH